MSAIGRTIIRAAIARDDAVAEEIGGLVAAAFQHWRPMDHDEPVWFSLGPYDRGAQIAVECDGVCRAEVRR